jgi:hypothetical protein
MHHLAEDEVVRGDHEEVAVQVALHARDDMQAEVTGRCVSGQAIHKHPLAQLHGHAALVHRDLEHMRAGLDRREAASGHVLDHHPCHALPARQHSTHVSLGICGWILIRMQVRCGCRSAKCSHLRQLIANV